ncbi:MAG TPA: BTAD domain-containing putative transcriptional regulator [Candidatus Dormibacteraeota bacterium]|nr:BTAD domain-containing putative transcriptional regulator [Candidatus Dormibacteraeota bacterium]
MREGFGAVVSAKVLIPQVQSLARERVDALLARIWQYRVGLVVAAAGSGKSTLLARFASSTDVPVAWYRAESWDAKTTTLLTHLHSAFKAALGPISDGWDSVETAARALETWAGRRALLVIDDLHTLEDSPAELTLERLIDYAPPSITFLMGSRALPGFNLSRLRVSGSLLEIGSEDLRFRSWEVERLFRDFYGEPLPPEELAELARRTEGWAAGLQLFHLATRGKSPQERRRILTALGSRSRLTREYLTGNVLNQLPAELRWFLVRTCVLTRLSGPICDAFLERTGSQQVLEELERRQIFTYATDDRGGYRYHEVLRSHLEQVLMEELGEIQARAAYRRAGTLLEGKGALPEAVQAYSRGEDWEAVDRLLHHQGGELLEGPDTWIDALPPALLRQDPWLMLGSARRHRAEGRWREAIDAYHRAELVFGSSDAGLICASERKTLAGWMEPAPMPGNDWAGLIRKAVAHDPLGAKQLAGQLPEATGKLTMGLICLLAGQLDQSRRHLNAAADGRDATAPLATAAHLWSGIAALLSGDLQGVFDVEECAEEAEILGLGWLARLARAALVLAHRPGSAVEAEALRSACARDGDRWGSALVALMIGWAAIYSGENAVTVLEQATDAFHRLGAGVLEAWSRALLSLGLARVGAAEAREAALQAENLARYSGTPGARYFPYLALAEIEPERAAEYRGLALAVQEECCLAPLAALAPAPPAENVIPIGIVRTAPSLSIHCFGGFSIAIHGRPVDLTAIKPRARAVLRLLAVHVGNPVHREVLQAAFWPDADAETGARNLHVAVSSLRSSLEPGVGRGGSSLLLREGDAYRLALQPEADVDLVQFSKALALGRVERLRGEPHVAIGHFRQALDLYAGELLPEDGPAEWVIEPRERFRAAALEAAQGLAELLLKRGDPAAAANACATGLWVDRLHDPLWRLLIDARERAGDPVAASRARRDYARVLEELGLTATARS